MADYLPDISQIEARLGLAPGKRLESIDNIVVDGEFLRFLISQIVSGFALDARAYRTEHKLSEELDWGSASSASEHYATLGFFKSLNAIPRNFDEDWYVATYPDVKRDVDAGYFADPLDHFLKVGRREGRPPNAQAEKEVRAWRQFLRAPPPPERSDLHIDDQTQADNAS